MADLKLKLPQAILGEPGAGGEPLANNYFYNYQKSRYHDNSTDSNVVVLALPSVMTAAQKQRLQKQLQKIQDAVNIAFSLSSVQTSGDSYPWGAEDGSRLIPIYAYRNRDIFDKSPGFHDEGGSLHLNLDALKDDKSFGNTLLHELGHGLGLIHPWEDGGPAGEVNIIGDRNRFSDEETIMAYRSTNDDPEEFRPADISALQLIWGKRGSAEVSLTVTPARIAENSGSAIVFAVERSGSTQRELTLRCKVSGSARAGEDYAGLSADTTTIRIPAGQSRAEISVSAIGDSTPEEDETIAVELEEGSGYSLSGSRRAVATLSNDDGEIPPPTDISLTPAGFRENLAAGTSVARLATASLSGGSFTYALVGGAGDSDNKAFTLRGDQLLIKSRPDYETKPSYAIRVRSSDSRGRSFSRSLTLAVENVAEVVRSSRSAVLAPDMDSLILTGKANIAGTGNAARNQLTGNSGNNTLDGREAADVLTGKGGADRFLLSHRPAVPGVENADHITDFSAAEGDRIQIRRSAFGLAAGATGLTTISAPLELAGALAGPSPWIYDRSSGELHWNQNGAAAGAGSGGLLAVLDNRAPLAIGDLQLI